MYLFAEGREVNLTVQLITTPIDGSEQPIFDPLDDLLSTYTDFYMAMCGPETSMIRTPAVTWILAQVCVLTPP